MTVEEAADILRRMSQAGSRRRRKMTYLVLFGIKYADELEHLSVRDISELALGKDFYTEIRHGINLAEYVQLRPDVDLGA